MVKRKLFNQLVRDLSFNLFVVITGARQVGKTTLLKQFLSYLREKKVQAFYINLEDPDFLNLLDEHPKNIFSLHPVTENEKVIFLIDEIQYLKNPTNFLKYLYDEFSDRLQLFVTGSSAFYLDTRFKDSLAGRKKVYIMNTLHLSEYLQFMNEEKLAQLVDSITYDQLSIDKIPATYKRELERNINMYMTYGGYPAVALAKTEEDKQEILRELVHSYIKKDVSESGIKNDQNVFNLLKILASQSGNLLNINSLAKVLRVSNTAIENYLYILRKSFILYFIQPFSKNIRSEIKKMPKVYFADLGLRNVLLKDFRPLDLKQDKGQVYENFIFRQFLDRLPNDEIKFWRHQQGNEVDYIIQDTFACEVKYNLDMVNPNKYNLFKKGYPEFPLKFIYHEKKSPQQDNKDYWYL